MTETHDLGMTHTEYAKLIAQGYDPNKRTPVDRAWRGRRPSLLLAPIVGLTQDKAPQTDEEWEEFTPVWGGTCDGSVGK